MIAVNNLSLQYGKRVLFDDVNVKFTQGNCYGVIGANGAGKSTFLKILSGDIESTTGNVEMTPGERMAVLKQNHFEFDDFTAIDTVIMGHKRLYQVMKEKDAIYAKAEFTDEDGIRVGELEADFAEMDGWNAESDAAELLSNLGVKEIMHYSLMKDLSGNEKVRILLAQAIFGNPDVLLLDEPTNDLDVNTIAWLENFLADFKNTVIVVSHDRHFLDMVCTHIVDIDRGKINIQTGNYSFWYEMNQIMQRQIAQKNKKAEDRKAELMEFIARFSANASKSKQATSRKKALDKLDFTELKPSSRRYPAIIFKMERELGNQIVEVKNISATLNDEVLFKNIDFEVNKGDKIAFVAKDGVALSHFFKIIAGETQAQTGDIKWGQTTKNAFVPNDNSGYFKEDMNLIDWLRQFSSEKDETFIRGFLGKMLFSGEETLKKCTVLSGGEKVRCMLSRAMLQNPNVLILDEPTNHLDLESITSLNEQMMEYQGVILFTSHDHALMQSVANRVIEVTPNGVIDKLMSYDDYINNEEIKAQRISKYLIK
jgi:ATPase subunit of ABC transporter with duplicated ATPase domains